MFDATGQKIQNPEKLVLYWRQNPVEAAKQLLGVELDNHQQVMLGQMWTNNTQLNVCSRGTGKTFVLGVCASLEGMLKSGHRIGLVGPSYRQSKFIWAEVEKLHEQSPAFQDALAKPPTISPDKCSLKFKAAPGKIGSVIEALPMGSDGGKIRGARYFSTYADEVAGIEDEILSVVVRGFTATSANPMEQVNIRRDQQALLDAGLITLDQLARPPANKIVYSGTAYYQYNHWWTRCSKFITTVMQKHKDAQRTGKDLSKFLFAGAPLNGDQIPHRVMSDGQTGLCAFTCMDPSPGFMNMTSIEGAKEEMSEYQFLMEYFGLFPADSEGFFRRRLLDNARAHVEFGIILEPRKGCYYAMGVDPARDGDNFSIAIFEIDPDVRVIRLARVMAWNKKNFPEMHQRIRELIRLYEIEYFEMDAGGGGTTIRDLLASEVNCPSSEGLILEQGFDEHVTLTGKRILGPLFQFSNYQLVHDANHNLLSGLQHGRLKIAAKAPLPGQIWTQELEDAENEIEAALMEMSSIVIKQNGSRMNWDTPTKSQRKDRYSAILIGYHAALRVLDVHSSPQTLASGFVSVFAA